MVSAKDIGGLPGAPHAGGYAHWGISVCPHDAVGDVNDLLHQFGPDYGNMVAGMDASDKTSFHAVFVADARDVF